MVGIMDWESSSDKEMMCKYLKERYKILKRGYSVSLKNYPKEMITNIKEVV